MFLSSNCGDPKVQFFLGLVNATHLDDRKTHLLTQISIAIGIEYINFSRQNGTFRLASLSRQVPRLVDRAPDCEAAIRAYLIDPATSDIDVLPRDRHWKKESLDWQMIESKLWKKIRQICECENPSYCLPRQIGLRGVFFYHRGVLR